MTQIARAKAIIDALAGQTVTNAKAEKVVRLYTGNDTADAEELAELFNQQLLTHCKITAREQARRLAEKAAPQTVKDAAQAAYDELDYTPTNP